MLVRVAIISIINEVNNTNFVIRYKVNSKFRRISKHKSELIEWLLQQEEITQEIALKQVTEAIEDISKKYDFFRAYLKDFHDV